MSEPWRLSGWNLPPRTAGVELQIHAADCNVEAGIGPAPPVTPS